MTITFYELMCGFGGLAIYLTIVCIFFYRLNEKSIEKLEDRMDKSETHWREMFMYFNSRFDSQQKEEKRN